MSKSDVAPFYIWESSIIWNWEMALLTQNARYSDLFEWQLYNATNVGMGQNGDTYLYNNPLEVHHGVTRQGWYVVTVSISTPSVVPRVFSSAPGTRSSTDGGGPRPSAACSSSVSFWSAGLAPTA